MLILFANAKNEKHWMPIQVNFGSVHCTDAFVRRENCQVKTFKVGDERWKRFNIDFYSTFSINDKQEEQKTERRNTKSVLHTSINGYMSLAF